MAYDLILAGTGFASAFFLHGALRRVGPNFRVLVLDAAPARDKELAFVDLVENQTPDKPWFHRIAFGGGSCWTGNTPRPHPSDFDLRTRIGRAVDWPFGYDAFEPYLTEAEYLFGISGGDSETFPRSRPYPYRPHAMASFERSLVASFPGHIHPMPSARSITPESGRAPCRTFGICETCPMKAKFEVNTHFADVFKDPRVELRFDARVSSVLIEAGTATGVSFLSGGRVEEAKAELVALGTNAVFNAAILLNSGLEHSALGRYLNEQASVGVRIELDGIDNFDGGQQVSGLGTMFLDHPDRSNSAGCLVEFWNMPWLGAERGRWRQRAYIKFVFESEPSPNNRVGVNSRGEPTVCHPDYDAWVGAGYRRINDMMDTLAAASPIVAYEVDRKPPIQKHSAEPHMHGTVRMGNNSEESIVDVNLVHHEVRNLAVLGGSAFPSCPAANPTLILSALSLKSAEGLFG